MKITYIFLVYFVLAACSACGPKYYSQQTPTMMDVTVVQLNSIGHDGEEVKSCTAWKVSEDRMVTAGHCCDYEAPVKGDEEDPLLLLLGVVETETRDVPLFHMQGEHAIPGEIATIVRKDDKHDICILKGKMRGAPIALATHDPAKGERVFTAGYPNGTFLISEGLWSGREDGRGVTSSVVWPGASGSPILNHEGRAVGVLVSFYRPIDSLSLVAPLEWLRTNVILAK